MVPKRMVPKLIILNHTYFSHRACCSIIFKYDSKARDWKCYQCTDQKCSRTDLERTRQMGLIAYKNIDLFPVNSPPPPFFSKKFMTISSIGCSTPRPSDKHRHFLVKKSKDAPATESPSGFMSLLVNEVQEGLCMFPEPFLLTSFSSKNFDTLYSFSYLSFSFVMPLFVYFRLLSK